MCTPEHFAVTYAINPWMEPATPTDPANAMRQWARLRQVYLDLGHDVRTIDPVTGLPDMVFAANGATVIGGRVLGARFRQRMDEARREAADPRFTREEHRALHTLGLESRADRGALRRRYSELVRRYHPDRNGGDRSHETRLGEVVAAYQLLRKAKAFA